MNGASSAPDPTRPTARPAPLPAGPLGLDDVAALGTVLSVWAHPDDESYLAAGTMAALSDAGRRVVSVTATLGEQGVPGLPPREAARQRHRELAAALEVLGIHEWHVMGVPDGGCAAADEDAAVADLAGLLVAVEPDTILTFGPDGMTGHPDHRTVSRWVSRARQQAAPRARLLHATLTPEQVRAGADITTRFDVMVDGGEPPQTPRADLAVDVVLAGAALQRKVAALRAHDSQTRGIIAELGHERYAAWVAEEAFVAAGGQVDIPLDPT